MILFSKTTLEKRTDLIKLSFLKYTVRNLSFKIHIVFIVLLSGSSLWSLSLIEYTAIVLRDSSDVLNLVDNETYARFSVETELNRFDFKSSPDSSVYAGDESNRVQIGFQGSKRNFYGGEVYGNVLGSRSKYVAQESEYSSEVRVGYRQSLWQKFGEAYNAFSLLSAKERLEVQKILNEEQKENIIIQAVRFYYDVLLNKKKIAIQKKSLQRSQIYYEAAEAKQQSGLVSKMDVYRAKISYLDQKKSLNSFIKRYEDSVETAIFFINQDRTRFEVNFDDEIAMFAYEIAQTDERKILSTNAAWLDLQSRERILLKKVINKRKELYPDLSLDTFYSRYSYNNDSADAFLLDESTWGITLSANYEFDKHAQEQELQILQIEKSRLLRDKRQLKHAIFKDLREIKSTCKSFKDDLEIESLKRSQAKESLEVAKIR